MVFRLTLAGTCLLGLGCWATAEEFRQSFVNQKFSTDDFKYSGPNARKQVKEGPQGLHIVLPAEVPKQQATGLVFQHPPKGDFEITTTFELVKADPPKSGYGVGAQLYIVMESPNKEAITLGRYSRTKEGHQLVFSRITGPMGKRKVTSKLFSAEALTGQLRLVRVGSEVTALVAREGEKEFQELHRFELGEAPLIMVRVGADPGTVTADSPFEIRIKDFSVVGTDITRPIPPAPEAAEGPSPRKLLLYGVAGGSALLLLLGGLTAWLFSRREKKAEEAKPQLGPPTQANKPKKP